MSFRPLVFLHIPKSSGIAVSHALLQAERPSRVFFGFDRAFFGGFADFAGVPEANRAFIHLAADTIPRDEPFVRAHMALSTLREAFPGGRFVTVLREPVCRILSHFAFWRGFTAEQDAGWGSWAMRSGLARGRLEDFLAAPEIACQIDNVATRLLLWPHPFIPDDGPIAAAHDAALAAAAARALDSFDYVNIIEQAGFYEDLASRLGAPLLPGLGRAAPILSPRMNETVPMPGGLRTRLDVALTPRTVDLLQERSRLDLVLWRRVAARVSGDVDGLRASVLLRGVARASSLLAGVP